MPLVEPVTRAVLPCNDMVWFLLRERLKARNRPADCSITRRCRCEQTRRTRMSSCLKPNFADGPPRFTPAMVAALLGGSNRAQAQAQNPAQNSPPLVYRPTRCGGGGVLRALLWQGPTQLNPDFSTGTKDADGARVFYEPLARWHINGELQPVLAAQIPTRANGGVAADGRSMVWKLKPGVTWHDGQPFTADNLLFNAAYATDPDPATSATSAAATTTTSGLFRDLRLVKEGSHTVRTDGGGQQGQRVVVPRRDHGIHHAQRHRPGHQG